MLKERKAVIAIAGLACETSTFSPGRTHAPAFKPKRGAEILSHYSSFLGPSTPLGQSVTFKGALIGHALPGGIVTREAFEELSGEIVERLRVIMEEGGVEGLWFDIHGAMCVEGLDDCEAVLLRRVKGVLGEGGRVSASMDLHGNVSKDLCEMVDLVTCYRTAPHIDVAETRERAVQNLVNLLSHSPSPSLPLKAWIPIPILLPGEQTSTRLEPATSLYAAVPPISTTPGIIDASIWVGYAWADEPRNRACVVVTGWDHTAVAKGAEHLATLFWKSHKEFKFVAPTGTFRECIDTAIASRREERPFFISDSGDNPTAGGCGDVSWGLTKLLERPEFKSADGPTVIYASLPGPKAIEVAVKAGIGATVTVTAGAEIDNLHSPPLTLTGVVRAIKHGDLDAHVEVVIQVGSVFAILTKLRKPYHKERDFTELGLRPREADVVIVKIGYLEPELFAMARGWMLGLTPGGVDQDLGRLGHGRIQRPMWPFDRVFESEPDLRARFVGSSMG